MFWDDPPPVARREKRGQGVRGGHDWASGVWGKGSSFCGGEGGCEAGSSVNVKAGVDLASYYSDLFGRRARGQVQDRGVWDDV